MDGPTAAEGAAGSKVPADASAAAAAGEVREVKQDGGQDGVSALKDYAGLLIWAGIWALLIYSFVFQISFVNGPSMLPNFHDEDKLVIDKITSRLTAVKRFDVIVFEAVDLENNPGRQAKDYIKRVIGLPGETVTIRGGRLWADGRAIDESSHKLEPYNRLTNWREMDERGVTFKVPPSHFFVMGDNRGDSRDSRMEGLGFVSRSGIKGLVRIRWWPWDRAAWFSRAD